MRKLPRLYAITSDAAALSHAGQCQMLCQAGVRLIQFRTKTLAGIEKEEQALRMKELCLRHGAAFIVNDDVELALKTEADGVHLGKADMLPSEARAILGPSSLIGVTVNALSDYTRDQADTADYHGVGPFRFTETKQGLSPVLSKGQLIEMVGHRPQAPKYAIGGVLPTDIAEICALGAHGVAVSGGIVHRRDILAAAQQYLERVPGDPC